jgi:hypothetical protein
MTSNVDAIEETNKKLIVVMPNIVSTFSVATSTNSPVVDFRESETADRVQQQQQQQQQQSPQSGIYTIIPNPPFIVAYLKQEDPENFVESSS